MVHSSGKQYTRSNHKSFGPSGGSAHQIDGKGSSATAGGTSFQTFTSSQNPMKTSSSNGTNAEVTLMSA